MLFSGGPQTARLRTLPLLVNHYVTPPIIVSQGPRKILHREREHVCYCCVN